MTTIIDGSAGVTFPAGGNPQAAPSKVLQVIQGTLSSAFSTSSSSYVTTGLTASITPIFSTSKILIMYNGSITSNPASQFSAYTTIYRNSTNLEITSGRGFNECTFLTGGYNGTCTTGSFLDSPATTSSTTYTIYLKGTQTTTFPTDGATATITIMEIAQ